MNNMVEVVLQIPKEEYDAIILQNKIGPKYLVSRYSRAIANGTVLPKGHGRLVDAENIDSIFHNKAFDLAESARYYDILWAKEIVCNAPTVIEADKEADNG